MPSKKRTATAVATKSASKTTNQTFSLKAGDYFRFNYHEREFAGQITFTQGYVNFVGRFNDGQTYTFNIRTSTPGRISSSKLGECNFKEFRLIRKSDYTKWVNKQGLQRIKIHGYDAVRQSIDNKPGWSFGCGAVKVTNDEIAGFLRVYNQIGKMISGGFSKADIDHYTSVSSKVIRNSGRSTLSTDEIALLRQAIAPSAPKTK
jgi:hypothetical protein